MRQTLFRFIQNYASEAGCKADMQEGSCQAELSVQGVSLYAGLLEESSLLLLQVAVGVVPDHDKELFYRDLLKANNLLKDTKGFTLGVDDDLVTLQISWGMAHLDEEAFRNLINNLLITAADWMIKLDSWRPEEKNAAVSDDAFLQQAMSSGGNFNLLKI